jgi:HlyD family secretion protein
LAPAGAVEIALSQETKAEPGKPADAVVQDGSGIVATPLEPIQGRLPVALPPARPPRRGWLSVLLALVLLGLAGGAGTYYYWRQSLTALPAGIVASNGRLEADEIDISTKFAGRVAALLTTEGSMVKAGQIIARMDTRDLEASLKRAEAQVLQSQRVVEEVRAIREQQVTQVALASQQLERTKYLWDRGNTTRELLDQRQQQYDAANAALNAANARIAQAEHALVAATNETELLKINIADNTLVAPREGRIQYRIANVGEVLPAGGKVFTMIDINSVYMDIYLPTVDAGRAAIGTEARIVLDAYPNVAIPGHVSFVATRSQFTPKTVETKVERERLMFRVRVRVDAELLRARAEAVRTGLPGIAYLRLDPKAEWPARLPRLATP